MTFLCDVYICLHFSCYGVLVPVMLQINEYDDVDDNYPRVTDLWWSAYWSAMWPLSRGHSE